MTSIDPHFLVRSATVYFTVVVSLMVWAWRRPHDRAVSTAILATLWNLPALLALHLIATRSGWWRFDATGGLLLGMPVDFYLAWAWLWGGVPLIAWPSAPLPLVTAGAFALDLALMPAASPVVQLGPQWLIGEAIALITVFVPGQLLGRWTARDVRLRERATLQVVAFAGLVLFVTPVIAITNSNGRWVHPLSRPLWQLSLFAHVLAVPTILGLSALQEFVTRGRGTPVPFDPPRRLVTTGPYAYVRNPMQIAGVGILVLLGVMLENLWVSAAGVLAHIYSAGLAGWDEDGDLRQRFGDDWMAYRSNVRAWIPGITPWHPINPAPPRLFVAENCGMCSEVARWFRDRHPRHLLVVAAETHPSRSLTRITYETRDGYSASGVEAVARGLEHLHLGWACVGLMLRLPIVLPLVQVIVDASGGEPRRVTPAISVSPIATPAADDPHLPPPPSDRPACST
jgi:protein-S-isoprenylcysteine O-methyltransferase Ste14